MFTCLILNSIKDLNTTTIKAAIFKSVQIPKSYNLEQKHITFIFLQLCFQVKAYFKILLHYSLGFIYLGLVLVWIIF